MKNPEEIYSSLLSLENFKGFNNEEALEKIGLFIDRSLDNKKTEGLNHALMLSG